MGTSGNRDCQWASRSVLKDFTEDALTFSAGSSVELSNHIIFIDLRSSKVHNKRPCGVTGVYGNCQLGEFFTWVFDGVKREWVTGGGTVI